MHAVVHVVRFESALDLLDDLVVRRNLGECQSQGRASQPVEVAFELEDPSIVQAQTLPDCIATWTAESNGLMPALSRWISSPLMLILRSRFFSLNF